MKTKNKKMTIEEEYRNADVPMPNDMLNSTNTEQFVKKAKEEYKSKHGLAFKLIKKYNIDKEKLEEAYYD